MIIENAYEVVNFIHSLPTVELQNKFKKVFREDYDFEMYTIDDTIENFLVRNLDELTDLGYIEEVIE